MQKQTRKDKLRLLLTLTISLLFVNAFGNPTTLLGRMQDYSITNYSSLEYLGGMQIWCVEQGMDQDVFLATSKGLSIFDGYVWRNYRNSNISTLRWLDYDNKTNRIYSTSDNEFGYWFRNQYGEYEYKMLYKNDNPLFSEIFWRVHSFEDKFFFQTQQKIYSYTPRTNKIETVLSNEKISYLYKYKGELYTQIDNRLYRYVNDKFTATEVVVDSRIVNILSLDDQMVLITEDLGILKVDDFKLSKNQIEINKTLSKVRPFSALQLSPDKIVIGSVLDGAIIVNNRFEIENHFNFQSGLKHTTVLSLGIGSKSSIWLGLDGGLAQIINNPSEIIITTNQMDIGSVYDALWIGNSLWMGTNKGLFRMDKEDEVHFIEGSQGQIWNLTKLEEHSIILCHDAGVFQLDTRTNKLARLEEGRLWRLIAFDNDPNIFLGLDARQFFSIYEKKNNTIKLKHKIEKLKAANTEAFIDRYGYIWVQDRSNKPIRIQLDNDLNLEKIKAYSFVNDTNSLKLTKVDGDIVFYSKKQAYAYDIAYDSIVQNQHYTDLIGEMQFYPRQIEQTDKDIFYYASAKQIAYIKRNENKFYNYGQIFQSITETEATSFAHKIIPIDNYTVATGIQGGVAMFFMKNQEAEYRTPKILEISQIHLYQNDSIRLLPILGETTHRFESNYSKVRVYFRNLYPNNLIEYKIGENGKWIVVQATLYLDIPHLASGYHEIYFRNADIYGSNNKAQSVIKIDILRPWYQRPIAFILFSSILIFIILSIRYVFKKRLEQQQRKIMEEQVRILEKEKKEFDLKILQTRLKEEEKKMIYLTMESVKFNSILNEIKDSTQKIKADCKGDLTLDNKLKDIIKNIDFHLKKEDPNHIFEKYFNAIHDGFYERLIKKHPSLTQSEMRLCAYIKLNLSTKEIATHINIAPSSVEVARYRLRKKMDLDSEINLHEYIVRI